MSTAGNGEHTVWGASHSQSTPPTPEVPPEALHLWELAAAASTPLGVLETSGQLVFANSALQKMVAREPRLLTSLAEVSSVPQQCVTIEGAWGANIQVQLEAPRGEHRLVFAWLAEEAFSHTDPLTGFGSRVRFEELTQSQEHSCLLLIDLDRFKQVNDTLGHEAGDTLLRLVAKRIRKAVRRDDEIARLGGDEFAIFCDGDEGGVEAAVRTAERVIKLLKGPFLVDRQTVHIGASVGVASLEDGRSRHEDLYRHADLALYAAKGAGGNTVRRFDSALEDQARDRRTMEVDLRQALTLKQFALHYQPQINTQDGGISGVEALLRWEHPTRGTLLPEEFVPMAEEIGEIRAIGEWTLKNACAHAMDWPSDVSVAVNVAARQLDDPNFLGIIHRALDQSGLDPTRLELEVTERVLMSNSIVVLEHLTQVRELGISVALDDFGTGYSSLNYLNRFPFSRIKIDRSFVQSQQYDARARNLVKCVLALGKSLGIHTLAEGIETEEQLKALTEFGCREGQGWYFGKPLTRGDLDEYLRTSINDNSTRSP
ncbi:MAG: bifunctional diguanylate cyclase/phosphodiesterase [Pseudomonadota bacterium]